MVSDRRGAKSFPLRTSM
ncbi:hypothetical protein Tco_1046985, partial [Tanacetum coccineum]